VLGPLLGHAQETRGQADIALQGYYQGGNSQPELATTGLAAGFQYYFDKAGQLQGHFEPNYDQSGVRSGENYLSWSGLPWQGFRWNFSGGDYRLSMRPSNMMQANLCMPELRLRGARVEMLMGAATISFFTGRLMVLQGNRLPFMYHTPQRVTGATFAWKKSDKLQVQSTLARIATDLRRLAEESFFLPEGRRFGSSVQSVTNSLWQPVKPLKFFGEASFSATPPPDGRPAPARFSGVGSAEYEAGRWQVRGQYQRENATFMPLAGYFLGDRQGPSGDARFQVTQRLTLFGSAARMSNNIERFEDVPSLRSTSATAGLSVQLPGRFFALGNYSVIGLRSRLNRESEISNTENRLAMLSLMKPAGRHNLRFSYRELSLRTPVNPGRMRSLEFEDNATFRRFTVGGGTRVDSRLGPDPTTTYYFRGNFQVHLSRLSAYAFGEMGRDRLNQTLFVANQMRTTVMGISSPINRHWALSAEIVRNTLSSELNPANVFLLATQGAPLSAVMDGLNRWNVFFRVSRTLRWGRALPPRLDGRGLDQLYPVLGAVEGFVREAGSQSGAPVAGVPVSLDGIRTEMTDQEGRYRFADVPQGQHAVQLPPRELPAEFDPAAAAERRVVVAARRTSRADLDVVRLCSVAGKIVSPLGAAVSGIVIRLEGRGRYTTPDEEGNFAFHNLPRGTYEAVVDVSTLPQDCRSTTATRVKFELDREGLPPEILFGIEQVQEIKPVRQVILTSR
jgi:hypothetical protein